MTLSEAERIVMKAIREKLIIEMDYVKKDGTRICRLMEPFDIKEDSRSKTREMVFWGWDLTRDRTEQRKIPSIISIRITDQHFDPKIRERTFKTRPDYRIPRDW